MSLPRLNNKNDQIIGTLKIESSLAVSEDDDKVVFKIEKYQVIENDLIVKLLKEEKIKLGFTLECDSTFKKESKFFGDEIEWHADEIGGKLISNAFLICTEDFKISAGSKYLHTDYNYGVTFKKHFLISSPNLDKKEWNIKKLNIGSAVNFISLGFSENQEVPIVVHDDYTKVKFILNNKNVLKNAKKLFNNKRTNPLIKQLLFSSFFFETLSAINSEDEDEKEWHSEFKTMFRIEDDDSLNDKGFNDRYNYFIKWFTTNNKSDNNSLYENVEKLYSLTYNN